MNTRIYFNDKYIEFGGASGQQSQNQDFIIYDWAAREKPQLKKIINTFLDASENRCVKLLNSSLEGLLPQLKEHVYYIEAAGGFIERNNEFLFIHRHGRWDLPKGKLEKNERVVHAAIRECEEECGISRLQIAKQLNSTFHIYPYKNGFALKQSYWFYMTTDYDKTLVPQIEEDIDKVEWFKIPAIRSHIIRDTYHTISDVVTEALNL